MEAGGSAALKAVGLFCGSSSGSDPAWAEGAARFGAILAAAEVRLVYGGGSTGLMGACAKAVVAGGGRPLGVIPDFLRLPEVAYEAAELVVVASMHARKAEMFERADGFVVMPGGIGTLEEAIEILSWSRLGLHAKPVVFLNLKGFWSPLFELIDHTVRERFTPAGFSAAYRAVESVDELLPTLGAMIAGAATGGGGGADMPLILT